MDILELVIQALRKVADQLERDHESDTTNSATLLAADIVIQNALTLLRQVDGPVDVLCRYTNGDTPSTRKE